MVAPADVKIRQTKTGARGAANLIRPPWILNTGILLARAPHLRRDCAGFAKSGAQSRADKRLDLRRRRRTAI